MAPRPSRSRLHRHDGLRAGALALAAALALAGTLLVVTGAEAKPVRCLVVNRAQHTAYATLQSAVDAASDSDTLRVKGTCVGSTTIATSLTVVGQSNPGFGPATLDGDHAGRVLTISGSVTVMLSGLTITSGAADYGGGIRFLGSGSLTLVESTVTGNTATAGGGGIYGDGGAVTLIESTVTANTGGFSGGIYNERSTLTLADSEVSDNASGYYAGGISNLRGTVVLNGTSSVHHNTAAVGAGIDSGTTVYPGVILNDTSSVHDNTASVRGGGIAIDDGGTQLNDASSVYNNTAVGDGGGIYVGVNGNVTLTGTSSIHHNTAGGDGGGIFNFHGTLTNCVAGSNVHHNIPNDIVVDPLL